MPVHPPLSRHARWSRCAWPVAVWLVTVVFAVSLGAGPTQYTPWRDDLLYNAQALLAGVAVVLGSRRKERDRLSWLLIGVGILASAAGDVTLSFLAAPDGSEPFPSWADALFLAFYPAAYVAISLLFRTRLRNLTASLWLDGLLAVLATLSALTVVVYGPISAEADGGAGPLLAALSYPLLDAVLISSVITLIVVSGRRTAPSIVALASGLLVLAGADLAYTVPSAESVYLQGAWFDALWPVAYALMVSAAWLPARPFEPRPAPGWLVHAGPLSSIAVATVVLTYGCLADVPPLAAALSAMALALGVMRLHLTIAQTRALTEETTWLATTDTLTGLPNRRSFSTLGTRVLETLGESGTAALVLCDVDDLTDINSSLGYNAGDATLREVTARLRARLGADDLLARIDGNQFAILLPGVDEGAAAAVVGGLAAMVDEPVEVAGTRLMLHLSTGMALYPTDATDLGLLVRRADIALDRAQALRTRHERYDATQGDPHSEHRIQETEALRRAIADGELVLHHQPKVALHGGALRGVEALVRWDRPGHGLVMPADFLPLADRAGLMPQLSAAVLRQAIGQARTWLDAGHTIPVAVNLPPEAVTDARLPGFVADLLRTHDLPGRLLTLEVTEDSLVVRPADARRVLGALRAIGVRISIDDFGAGYSSLAHLRDLPVDELKLDRAFVAPITTDRRAASIVRSTIDLAHALDLRVVAEGVEDEATGALLAELDCDTAQGYLYSRPVPAAALLTWALARERAGVRG